MESWRFTGIGTSWEIDTARELSGNAKDAVSERVERFDRDWSRFREDSRIQPLRSGPATIDLPEDAAPMLELCTTLYRLTDGAMSPAVGVGLEHLGYDPSYSLRPAPGWVPAPAWSEVTWTRTSLTSPGPLVLDVGSMGKGYLVDLVAAELASNSSLDDEELTVDAGGDMLRRGAPIRVALEHPLDPRMAVGVATLGDAAICASAPNRRAWGDGVHHVLDARTGRPTQDVLATWVVAADALTADALATALFFVPAQRLADHFDFEHVRITRHGGLEHSPDFPGELFR